MNKKKQAACLLLALFTGFMPAKAQVQKFWIGFKNKNGTPYTLNNMNAFLSAKSINRRVFYNVPGDVSDLPVTPAYMAQVDNVNNVTVLYASKWLNGVVVSIPASALPGALNTIMSFSFVSTNSRVNRNYKLQPLEPVNQATFEEGQAALRSAATNSLGMGVSYWQNHQLNVDCLHNMGYRGQGMTIAVLDVGFNNVDGNPLFDSLRARNGILGTRDFVSGGTSVYEDPTHGAYVLSTMAAIKPNVFIGSAPRADYWLLRTEDDNSETPIEEYNWVRGAEFADSVGADILTTSLGYTTFDAPFANNTYATLNGRTAPMSIAATMAARKGLFVLNAAGNEAQSAWHFIGVPADADSICTVGAIDSTGAWAVFSSVGPTADGRIKPDLVAMGQNAWLGETNGTFIKGNGTSFATPIMAGAVACFWQAHRERKNMDILQLLKASGTMAAHPDTLRGWGRPDMCAAAPLGIFEILSQYEFSVNPNPFQNVVTVQLVTQGSSQATTVTLNDVQGRLIQKTQLQPGMQSITLDTSTLPAGVYFVRLGNGGYSQTKKIVKQ